MEKIDMHILRKRSFGCKSGKFLHGYARRGFLFRGRCDRTEKWLSCNGISGCESGT
jgi:hypothetical protein